MTLALNLAVCAACATIVALGARLAWSRGLATRASVGASCLWAVLLVVWVAYSGCGFVKTQTPGLPVLVALVLALLVPLTMAAPGVRGGMGAPAARAARLALPVLGVPVAFLLLELPYNDLLLQMAAHDVALNLALLAAGLFSMWFVLQRSRWGLVLFAALCLAFGLANYFLCYFKGQTVLPADLLALGTAAEVSSGYAFVVADAPVAAVCLFLAYVGLALLVPSAKVARRAVAVNLVAGFGLAALLVGWYAGHDLKDDYGVTVDVWSTRDSYIEYGSVPCFLQRMQEIEPQRPQGYSRAAAAQTRAELAAAWDEAHSGYPASLAEAAAYHERTTGSDEFPHVVVVMNESFSDLSMYPGVSGYAGTATFDAVDAALRGQVYTSVRGGGTCNSEFEYLTGATLGSMGGGVYPYMFYDLAGAESLPDYFGALGYATTAVHPEAPTNWRRDVVYLQLGFNRFLDQDAFDPDAARLRGLVTDRETYDLVLEVLAGAQGPQFVFDVTLQNHGGYETGLLDVYPYDGVRVNGVSVAGMSEYLSCIDASQEDLAYFLDALAGLDHKVLVVFFGDHQPGFNDAVAEAAYGTPVEDLALGQVQQRFAAPYLVWANYDLGASWPCAADTPGAASGTLDMSLGYLMANTAYAAGLPLSEWQKSLLQLQVQMPAVNLNGYMDAQGAWYWIGQDGPAAQAYRTYEQLQYAQLYSNGGEASLANLRESL